MYAKKLNCKIESTIRKDFYFFEPIYHLTDHCPFNWALNEYGLLEDLFIPQCYLINSREKRLKLLAGIIDKLGVYLQSSYKIISSPILSKDILFIARSLGFIVEIKNQHTIKIKSSIYARLEEIPVKEMKKCAPIINENLPEVDLKYKFSIVKKGVDYYYGFEIDGNRRFVLADFTVTHNTVMSLKIISVLSKKTLILVHKEFLMNQWIERIQEFLPTARVGIIQGPKFEVDNKDIVIGMIQSIYDKVYPMNTFSSFGLTIIDEVHRIGSEEFSKTLTKIVTPYMLGISATVDRKDGLTKVLHMFIGEKLCSLQRENKDPVQVRAIEYKHFDEEYNKVEYDFRDNVKYSTMISKVSDFVPRSLFLVKVIRDLFMEDDEKQIMVLSHTRALLTFLYDSFTQPLAAGSSSVKTPTIGYYVGGMKEVDLKETETKQIVLATYAMAAEALDIKSLNTLVMVTPKTDIIQSVGRILRTQGDGKIVVDIVDTHEVFQNQWKKRRAYYKKCNYLIRQTDSAQYKDMMDIEKTWKKVFTPNTIKSTVPGSSSSEEEDDEGDNNCEPVKQHKLLINLDIFNDDPPSVNN
jgi:superfamily II DNA or RNA helicase